MIPEAADPRSATPEPDRRLGRRAGAALIDFTLLGAIDATLFFVAATRVEAGPAAARVDVCEAARRTGGASLCTSLNDTAYVMRDGEAVRYWAAIAAVSFVFLVVVPALVGGSVGKLLLGLRVVDAEGRPASLRRHFLRWLLLPIDLVPGCFPIVALSVARQSPWGQRVGDRVATTYVVSRERQGLVIEGPTNWGAATATPAASGAAPSTLPPGATMRWDPQWQAWLYWDPNSQRWSRHDPATDSWIPI